MAHNWQATFISGPTSAEAGDPAVYFRRDFTVEQQLLRATMKVTALGIVEPYLNGVRVGNDVLAPGWTSYRHRLIVSSYDVTAGVTAGANTLGAIVGEGWAVGGFTWAKRRHNYADRPALFLQLELEYADRTEVIGSGGGFRVGTGAVQANGIYRGETYDARLEPNGWNLPGFDDGGWADAQPFDWNVESLQEPVAPPIRKVQELDPTAVLTSPSGKTIVDFGQNLSGWVRFTVTGNRGEVVTLRHAELLTPDGDLETETNRGAEATDRYILHGGGEETWEPGFTFHGFRYVQVDGWPGEVDPSALKGVAVHSDMVRTGWFESSNELVNRLHSNAVWSMRGNFVGIPTDCPQRDERLGWTGDINAFAPTAAFLYDVSGVLGSWLQDLAMEQKECGTVPWVVPNVLPTKSPPTALWSDVVVSLPWNLYLEYGDTTILRQSYPAMTAFIRQVEPLLDETGLWGSGFQFGDWLDPDAPADNPAEGKTDRYLVASAYLCRTTREITETARLLGEEADAAHYAALHDRTRAAFRREFVTGSGRVVNETATAYALAIMFGILDEDQKQYAGNQLSSIVRKAGYRISTGFAGTPLVTDALSSTGHLDAAYRLLLETGCPSFLYSVTMGATTIWERWDAVRPDGTVNSTGMTSLNHYALGAVADWLHRVVGGLTRIEPGWSRIRFAPQPGGGITSGAAAHQSRAGRAAIAWRTDDGDMVVDIVVPEGATAEVLLPFRPGSGLLEVGSGPHSWRYALPEGSGTGPVLTMDSPLADIMAVPAVWDAVTNLLGTNFPHLSLDTADGQTAAMSLDMVLQRLPFASEEFQRDLRGTLIRS